jgi:hypothetical protein
VKSAGLIGVGVLLGIGLVWAADALDVLILRARMHIADGDEEWRNRR